MEQIKHQAERETMKILSRGNREKNSRKVKDGFALLHSLFLIVVVCAAIMSAASYINTEVIYAEKFQTNFSEQLAEKNSEALRQYEAR